MPVYNRVEERIRSILKGTDYLQVNVDGLAEDADLYAAGLNSHATVNLMLSLEEAFDPAANADAGNTVGGSKMIRRLRANHRY